MFGNFLHSPEETFTEIYLEIPQKILSPSNVGFYKLVFNYVYFSIFQVDKSAVVAASDEQLRQLGLRAQGDILALRVFCAKEQLNDDREKLTEAIKANKRLVGVGTDKKLKKVEQKKLSSLDGYIGTKKTHGIRESEVLMVVVTDQLD